MIVDGHVVDASYGIFVTPKMSSYMKRSQIPCIVVNHWH